MSLADRGRAVLQQAAWRLRGQKNSRAKALLKTLTLVLLHTLLLATFTCGVAAALLRASGPSSQDLDRFPDPKIHTQLQERAGPYVLDLRSNVILLPPIDDKKI